MTLFNLYIKTCLSFVSDRLFGSRVVGGEPVSTQHTFKTCYPSKPPSESEWIKQVHFGRMYNKTKDKFFDR